MDHPAGSRPASARYSLLLAAILAAAAALRTIGLDFGLPAVYNPDEIAIMSRALGFARGDLNPHNFVYPTFYFYVLFAWLGGYFVLAWLTGFVSSLSAFQQQFFTDPSSLYLAGRAFGVTCGVLGVAVTFGLARRLGDRTAAVAAALFLAIAPFAVRDAHYVKHDVPVTLAIVGAVLAALRLADEPDGSSRRLPWTLLAGALAGGALATHYYAVFAGVPLALAIIWVRRPWTATLRELAAGGLAALATLFSLSPFLFLDASTAMADIAANRQVVVDRAIAGGGGWFASAPAYLVMLWRDAAGWPVIVLAAIGSVILARQSWRRAVLVLAFPIVFLAFIGNTVPMGRYLNPVLPFVAALAGLAVSAISTTAGRRRVWLATGLAVTAALPGLTASVRADAFFRQTDTRSLALAFIERTIPPGTTIAVQPYSVPLTQSRDSLVESLRAHLGDERRASIKFQIRLALDPYPAPAYRLIFIGDGGLDADKIYVSYRAFDAPDGLGALRAVGVTYVVVKRYNVDDPGSVRLVAALAAEARLVARFSPYRPDAEPSAIAAAAPFLHNTDARISAVLERPGPIVEIWSIDAPGP